jgi:hypothetical protein
MLAHVTEKLKVAHAPHPVGVVDDMVRGDGRNSADATACVAQDGTDLPLNAGDVGGQFVAGEEVAFLAPPARITDHPRGTADQGDRFVAGMGHTSQQHKRHQMPHVEAVGGRVEAGIDAAAGRGEPLAKPTRVGRLMDQATGLEIRKKVV